MRHGVQAPTGAVGFVVQKAPRILRPKLEIINKGAWIPDEVKQWNPRSQAGLYFKSIAHYLPANASRDMVSLLSEVCILESSLKMKVARFNPDPKAPRVIEDHGIVSYRAVTDSGVAWLVDCWRGFATSSIVTMVYHGIGLTWSGQLAEAQTNTTLGNELTTTLNPDNIRATGVLTQGGSNNVLSSVATNTVDFTPLSIVEHGIFNSPNVSAAGPTNVLWDRSTFLTITLSSGDSLQSTYDLTFTAGG